MTLHPAVLLLAWIGATLALQAMGLYSLIATLGLVLPVTLMLARNRLWRLLRRSRWLLLSLALLFVFGTPGEYVGALPGATWDGLQLAAENILRLALLLQMLALLLQQLSLERLMGGLFLLLAPATLLGFDRRQAVARLMLVLEYVQGDERQTQWRDWLAVPAEAEPDPLLLPVFPLTAIDYAALALLGAALLGGFLNN